MDGPGCDTTYESSEKGYKQMVAGQWYKGRIRTRLVRERSFGIAASDEPQRSMDSGVGVIGHILYQAS